MKFDYIFGNPPFQDNKNRSKTQHKLWIEFTTLAHNTFLKEGGRMIWITPASWASPSNKVFKMFKETNVQEIHLDIGKYFPSVGSTFSFYDIKKESPYGGTTFYNEGESFNLAIDESLKYIPNDFCDISMSIHKKVMFGNDNFEIHYDYVTCHNVIRHKKKLLQKKIDEFKNKLANTDREDKRNLYMSKIAEKQKELDEAVITVSKERTKDHVHPLLHTNKQIWYSSILQSFASSKKVMWSRSGYTKAFYDDGELGCTDMGYYILVDDRESGQNLASFMNSRLMRYIFTTAKWSGFGNEIVFSSIPKIQLNKKLTDKEIYSLFSLTEQEIDYIKNYSTKSKKSPATSTKAETKTIERIKELGEVFTPIPLVEKMLDLVDQNEWSDPDKTFFDPACGNGNFLVAALKKKIDSGVEPIDSLRAIYGVDIMKDNILDCRKRLLLTVMDVDATMEKEYREILDQNIRCGNTLENDLDEIYQKQE